MRGQGGILPNLSSRGLIKLDKVVVSETWEGHMVSDTVLMASSTLSYVGPLIILPFVELVELVKAIFWLIP